MMSTMNISLPEQLKNFVDEHVAMAGYGTSSEYVRELIRRDQDRLYLRSLIIEGIGEADQKRLIKVVMFDSSTSINQLLTIDNEYLVVGNSDGTIRFYDF